MEVLTLALRVALSLGFVVLLLWYIQRRVARAQHGARTGDPLVIVSRRGLGQKSSVVVVETDGKRFLLGVTEQSVNVLHTSDAPAPAPDAAPAPGTVFALKLAAATGDATGAGTGAEGEDPAARLRQPPPLQGSVLSPATWRQAGQAIRKGLLG